MEVRGLAAELSERGVADHLGASWKVKEFSFAEMAMIAHRYVATMGLITHRATSITAIPLYNIPWVSNYKKTRPFVQEIWELIVGEHD